MDVSDGIDNLYSVAFYLDFKKPLPLFQDIMKRLVRTNLQQHVDILLVLKKVLELAHVLVVHHLMDFYLVDQLLLLVFQLFRILFLQNLFACRDMPSIPSLAEMM